MLDIKKNLTALVKHSFVPRNKKISNGSHHYVKSFFHIEGFFLLKPLISHVGADLETVRFSQQGR